MTKRRTRVAPPRLLETHADYLLLTGLEDGIIRHAGGWQAFRRDIPALLRQAIDEVIDAPRSKRFTVAELEKTEKTYIGTKVEILLRNHLGVERGEVMDLLIDGTEVDVKNTIKFAWTIPNETLNHPCILISADEESSLCSFGLIVIRSEVLNTGRNRDQKTTIRRDQLHNALWMLFDQPYPGNFWQYLSPEHRQAIMKPRGGTERLARLFTLYQRRPISRTLVQALAQQHDYMKRLRKNGGARDLLKQQGVALLSGKTHRLLITQLGLPQTSPEDFISVTPTNSEEHTLLAAAGEL